MKPIKNYFLFFSEHPIFYNFIIWSIGIIGLYQLLNRLTGLEIFEFNLLLILFTGIIILHVILIYWVISKKILRKENYMEDDSLFHAALTDKEEEHIFGKPLWEKGNKYEISSEGYKDKEIRVKLNYIVDSEKLSIVIPYSLTLYLSSGWDSKKLKLEVFKELLKHCGKDSTLSFPNYCDRIFNKFNEKKKDDIKKELVLYANQDISKIKFMEKLHSLLNFPERVFSNVKGTKLVIEEPTYSFCKGFGCSEN